MCGITGFYDIARQRGDAERRSIVQAMNDALVHRGPDSGAISLDGEMPLAFGHRRLAIVDLSATGAQPMVSMSGRYEVIYNGEIYNFRALRRELEKAGAAFKGHSDTEVFLTGCDVWGLNVTLQKMIGMFAIVLWDREEAVLHFIRDRLGKKPLYLGWAGKDLVWGSELKAIRAHPDFVPRLNQRGLEGYLRYACIHAPMSIYDGMCQLLPGHICSVSLRGDHALRSGQALVPMMKPYWRAVKQAAAAKKVGLSGAGNPVDVLNDFESVLSQVTKERMIADVPLGAFLSGGIDSSAIVALMQKHSDKPVQTYSIGFEEAGFDEAASAKAVAQHLGTQHHELYLKGSDSLAVIPELIEIYDEPFADISAIPTLMVSRFARRDVTVALSGDGGDEMLGGYNRYTAGPALWRRLGWMPWPVRATLAKLIDAVPAPYWQRYLPNKPEAARAMHKLAGAMRQKNPAGMYDYLCSHWQDVPLMETVLSEAPALLSLAGNDNFNLAEQMMLADVQGYLPSDILTKVDRASMACALEVRAPLLDPRLFDYVWHLPHAYKIRGGQGKWLLRQLLARYVPEDLFNRPKQGFSMPVGQWLCGPLKDWAEDLLSEESLKRYADLDVVAIRQNWQDCLQGKAGADTKIWVILMFQAWAKRWL